MSNQTSVMKLKTKHKLPLGMLVMYPHPKGPAELPPQDLWKGIQRPADDIPTVEWGECGTHSNPENLLDD